MGHKDDRHGEERSLGIASRTTHGPKAGITQNLSPSPEPPPHCAYPRGGRGRLDPALAVLGVWSCGVSAPTLRQSTSSACDGSRHRRRGLPAGSDKPQGPGRSRSCPPALSGSRQRDRSARGSETATREPPTGWKCPIGEPKRAATRSASVLAETHKHIRSPGKARRSAPLHPPRSLWARGSGAVPFKALPPGGGKGWDGGGSFSG